MKTNRLCVAAVLAISGLAFAQPSTMPDSATPAPLEMGIKPVLQGASAPLPANLKPRMRPELKPRMKSDELKPELRSEQRPEMSPGLQPNSQKPLRTDAPTKRVN